MRLPILLTLSLASAACTPSSSAGKDKAAPAPGQQVSVAHDASTAKACLGIVNGAASGDYPAVVRVATSKQQICTGTFVGGNTLLTAAHCIDDSPTGGLTYVDADQHVVATAVRAFHNGTTGEGTPAATDLAVVLFPDGTAPAVSPLAGAAAQRGDAVTIVGYGTTTDLAPGGGVPDSNQGFAKYSGANTVRSVSAQNLFLFGPAGPAGPAATAGSGLAVSGFGDSGGPMFDQGAMVGTVIGSADTSSPAWPAFTAGLAAADQAEITSLEQSGTVSVDMYVNLSSPESQGLLATAKSGGAAISSADPACLTGSVP